MRKEHNMSISQFNLKPGQRAERKLLITVAEWSEGEETPVREILGTRTEDSSIEYNADIATSTDILGHNYTDINKTQPQQDFDPYLVLGGSKLGAYLNDIRKRNALSELSDFTMYIITAFVGTDGNYEAEKHTGCTITYNSMGGDANVNFPISVYFSNNITNGTVDKLSDDFKFSAVEAVALKANQSVAVGKVPETNTKTAEQSLEIKK